jgi:hypothetical protein
MIDLYDLFLASPQSLGDFWAQPAKIHPKAKEMCQMQVPI